MGAGDPSNTWRREAAELLREAFLVSLQPDIVLISSLFEGLMDDAVTSIGVFSYSFPTAVILYNLIPFIHPQPYLENPVVKSWYLRKIDHLQRADLRLAISESSRGDGIDYLGLSTDCVVNISTTADDTFRAELIDHNAKQAKKFSWDESARRVIVAFERFLAERQKNSNTIQLPVCRLKLAYISPLPPERSSIADYSAELLPELARYYDIEVIVAQPEVSDPWIKEHLPIRNFEWFIQNSDRYDRVLYSIGNSHFHHHMFDQLDRFPGVIILHDFFLGGAKTYLDFGGYVPGAWVHELYESHGYAAVWERFHAQDTADVIFKYPCNFSVLQRALGVIVHSVYSVGLGLEWYGDMLGNDWTVIPLLRTSVKGADRIAAREEILIRHAPYPCAEQYALAIETFYASMRTNRQALIDALARLENIPDDNETIMALSIAIAQNLPSKRPAHQLLVDISELVQRDAKSGIQRVTRSILKELLHNAPTGYRVEPVYATTDSPGYRYAREFTLRFLECPPGGLADDLIEAHPGDIFLGLDLQPQVVSAQLDYLESLRCWGVQVYFVAYDMLPIFLPHMFPEGMEAGYAKWLSAIVQFDGGLCISHTIADELTEWLRANGPKRLRPFKIGWFHLGADVESSLPTYGLPDNAPQMLAQLTACPSFLMVGTVEPRKGYAQTLAAFEQLWAEGVDVNLIVVGKQGWMTEKLAETLRNHLEQGKRLFWLEGISDEYLEKVYAASTCLIAASEGEGFGLPLIEAAQHKLPIVARDIPVFREVAGEHAFYFSSKEPNDLAKAIREWLALYRSGQHPRSDKMPWLTWKQSTQQLLDIILQGK